MRQTNYGPLSMAGWARILANDDSGEVRPLGSGFVLGDRWVMTAEHVLSRREGLRVWVAGREVAVQQISALSSAGDIAVLELEARLDAAPIAWRSGAIGRGDGVAMIGAANTNPQHREDRVDTAITNYDPKTGLFELRDPPPEGYSGGPVLCGGAVAGMVVRRKLEFPQRALMIPAGRLQRALAELGIDVRPPRAMDHCPFPGLGVLDEKHALLCGGRSRELAACLKKLGTIEGGRYGRWLHLEGPSGVGKSSFVQAVLIPAFGEAVRAIFRPGADPIFALAACLARAAGDAISAAEVLAQLRMGPDGFRSLRARREFQEKRIIVAVDQFEELFTACSSGEDRALFDRLLASAIGDSGSTFHWVTISRSDFALDELPELRALARREDVVFALAPLDAESLAESLEAHGDASGLAWAPGLIERIIQDAAAERGGLPLIAHTLEALWPISAPAGEVTLRHYNSLGGLSGALAAAADKALEILPDSEARVRSLFLALIAAGKWGNDARRPIEKARAIDAVGGDVRLLELLSGAIPEGAPPGTKPIVRLIVVQDESRVELIHEALIRHWPRLRRWIEEARPQLLLRDEVEAVFQRGNPPRDPELGYYEGRHLPREGREAHLRALSPEAASFLRAAREHESRRRRVARGVVALIALVMVALSGWAVWERGRFAVAVDGALAAASAIHFQADRKLAPIAGAGDVRRELLETSKNLLIQLKDPLRADDPRRNRAEMVVELQTGDWMRERDRLQEAIAHYRRGIELASAPEDLIFARLSLGDALLHSGDAAGAQTEYRRALETGGDERGVALAQLRLGEVTAALKALEALSRREPENRELEHDLSAAHLMLAERGEDARKHQKRALELREDLARREPFNALWRKELSAAHRAGGDLDKLERNYPAARASYAHALEELEALAVAEPDRAEWSRELAVTTARAGDVEVLAGNHAAALEKYATAQAIFEALAEQARDHPSRTRDVTLNLIKLGGALRAIGRTDEARRQLNRAASLAQDPRDRAMAALQLAVITFEVDRDPQRALEQLEPVHREGRELACGYAEILFAAKPGDTRVEEEWRECERLADGDARLGIVAAAFIAANRAIAGGAIEDAITELERRVLAHEEPIQWIFTGTRRTLETAGRRDLADVFAALELEDARKRTEHLDRALAALRAHR